MNILGPKHIVLLTLVTDPVDDHLCERGTLATLHGTPIEVEYELKEEMRF